MQRRGTSVPEKAGRTEPPRQFDGTTAKHTHGSPRKPHHNSSRRGVKHALVDKHWVSHKLHEGVRCDVNLFCFVANDLNGSLAKDLVEATLEYKHHGAFGGSRLQLVG
jgi:hypothetical protein